MFAVCFCKMDFCKLQKNPYSFIPYQKILNSSYDLISCVSLICLRPIIWSILNPSLAGLPIVPKLLHECFGWCFCFLFCIFLCFSIYALCNALLWLIQSPHLPPPKKSFGHSRNSIRNRFFFPYLTICSCDLKSSKIRLYKPFISSMAHIKASGL